MNKITESLSKQLLLISAAVALIVSMSLFIVLPTIMKPVYEENIYRYLELPLYFLSDEFNNESELSEVAYIIVDEERVITTNNIHDLIDFEDYNELIDNMPDTEGNFRIGTKVYYYHKMTTSSGVSIAITDDSYIEKMKEDIFYTVTPIFFFTFVIIGAIIFLWSQMVVKKIGKLKDKIDNIDNNEYLHDIDFAFNDELNVLAHSLEDMRNNLIIQEDFRNQMYQNISHDFKTPIAVIRSYSEAALDDMHDKDSSLKIIDEQAEKLQGKVHSLLYLNKLNYLEEKKKYVGETVDVSSIIKIAIEKFKFKNKQIVFKTNFDDNIIFNGTFDMWEAVIDNLLNNATRYAKKEIAFTIKNKKIIVYNDGANIDKKVMNTIFTPYKTGIGGQFGFGLSIVSKTVQLFGYDISVENTRKGVRFIIE